MVIQYLSDTAKYQALLMCVVKKQYDTATLATQQVVNKCKIGIVKMCEKNICNYYS